MHLHACVHAVLIASVLEPVLAIYNFNILHNVYMGVTSQCTTVSGSDAENGRIASHLAYGDSLYGFVAYYGATTECYVTLDVSDYAADARLLLVSVGDIDLAPNGVYPDCDQLYVYDGNFTAPPVNPGDVLANFSCTTTPAAEVGTLNSTGSTITVHFYPHHDNHYGNGFQFHYSVFREGSCSSSEFQCDGNRCIPNKFKCDMLNHCIDATDESETAAGCTLSILVQAFLGWLLSLSTVSIIFLALGFIVFIFLVTMFCCCCIQPRRLTRRAIKMAQHDGNADEKLIRNHDKPSDSDSGDEGIGYVVHPRGNYSGPRLSHVLRKRRHVGAAATLSDDAHDVTYLRNNDRDDTSSETDPESEKPAAYPVESTCDLEEYDSETDPESDGPPSIRQDSETGADALKLLFETLFQTAARQADRNERREIIMGDIMYAMNAHNDRGTFNQ